MKAYPKNAKCSELAIGGIIPDAGTSEEFEVGSWRSERPVFDEEKCIQCLICWISCPDSAIKVKDGKRVGLDLNACKGCGICDRECPPKADAIKMVPESDFRK
jgi:pyruvate ferredoxin oxidoreductase delta subunit